MENSDIDKLSKDILQKSKLKISNPDFNNIIMEKIIAANRKVIILYNLLYYSAIFVSVDVLILIILKFFNISILKFKLSNISFSEEILSNLHQFVELFAGNSIIQYSVISLLIVLIFNKLSTTRLKY